METYDVRLSAGKVHKTLMKFFTSYPEFEIKNSTPSHMEVKVKTTWLKAPHGGPCNLRINIYEKNEKTRLEFDCTHRRLYLVGLIIFSFIVLFDFLINLLLQTTMLGELSAFAFVLFCILVIWGSRREKINLVNEIKALLKGTEEAHLL